EFFCKVSFPCRIAMGQVGRTRSQSAQTVSYSAFPSFNVRPAVSEKPLTSDQFVVLIARHERRVRSFIVSLAAGSADAVDEVLQATYLVAWQKLHSFSYVEATPD